MKEKEINTTENFRMKCPKCGTLLRIKESIDAWPGCKEREEILCPVCKEIAYSSKTSGFLDVEIEKEDNNEQE